MRPIDFLPPKYREQTALDQAKLWHLGVLSLFGAVVAAAAIFQFTVRTSVSAELADVDLKYQQAQLLAQQLNLTAQDLERSRTEARLYAYLEHDWPRSQVLSLLATEFPDEVVLTETRIEIDNSDSRHALSSEQASAPAKPAPAIADLNRIRSFREGARTVMHLSGSTKDVPALHTYLAELAAHPLVAKAELLSLEQTGEAESGTAELALFRARISIRPNYTQPGGPAMPAEIAPAVATPEPKREPTSLAGGAK